MAGMVRLTGFTVWEQILAKLDFRRGWNGLPTPTIWDWQQRNEEIMATLTDDMIDAGMSDNGGLNYKQLRLLGVKLPLKAGWKSRLIGKEIEDEVYRDFIALRNSHLDPNGVAMKAKVGRYRQIEKQEREKVIVYLEKLGLTLAAEGIHNLDHHK